MTYNTDIAVIGGGASGLVAAITAKRQAPHLDVYIFEALDRVGKKLITTGNGRCNITNRNLSHARYHGNDVDFAMDILGKCGNKDIEDFFISIGVPFVFEGDKGYPASLQASSVVDCLRYECDRLGIKTVCNCKIKSIKKQKAFVLTSDKDSIYSKTVICCAGLYSGGEKLGSDGSI
jgi:predicted Rossmann fold flavoprotein